MRFLLRIGLINLLLKYIGSRSTKDFNLTSIKASSLAHNSHENNKDEVKFKVMREGIR